MSSKRKQSSLSQSSGSGSDLSDAGKDMKMLATKKQKQSSYAYSSDDSKSSSKSRSPSRSKSRSRSSSSGSDSGTAKSRSASRSSKSRSRSRSTSHKSSGSGSDDGRRQRRSSGDSGTAGSDTRQRHSSSDDHKTRDSNENVRPGGGVSDASSSSSERSKRLLKASERKPSNKLQSAINDNQDSDNEDSQDHKKPSSSSSPKKKPSKSMIESWRDEFDDGLDSDLVGDDHDRDALEEMTEKQREEELFRRAERREELKKRYEISRKLRLQKEDKRSRSRSSSSSSRSKSRTKESEKGVSSSFLPTETRRKGYDERHGAKFSALNNLKAAREEKERKEKERIEKEKKHKKKHSGSDSDSESRKSKKKMKASDIYSSSSSGGEDERRKTSSSSSSSSSVSSISSGESDTERHKSKKVVKKARTIETREDLERIRLSRFKLDKFVHLPIFKKTVVGCFVRIGIGHNAERNVPVYRIAEITDVCETAKVYSVMQARTNVGLRLKHGKNERVFRAQFISNSPFTDSEFIKWKQTCEDEHVEIPTVQVVEEKSEAIRKALTYRFSSHDVDKILQSKEKFSKHPHNYAMTKAKLQKEREQQVDAGNQEEVEKLDQKLADLEERAEDLDRKRTSSIASIALINDRNRKSNILRAEKAIKIESARMRREGHVDDPFTRRKTQPILSMPKMKESIDEEEMTSEKLMKLELEKKRQKEMQLQVMKDRENEAILQKKRKIKTEVAEGTGDIFNAHDFEIDINVAEIKESSVPTSIAVKPVSASSSSLSGPSKRSIKFEEYKKKKGLI